MPKGKKRKKKRSSQRRRPQPRRRNARRARPAASSRKPAGLKGYMLVRGRRRNPMFGAAGAAGKALLAKIASGLRSEFPGTFFAIVPGRKQPAKKKSAKRR